MFRDQLGPAVTAVSELARESGRRRFHLRAERAERVCAGALRPGATKRPAESIARMIRYGSTFQLCRKYPAVHAAILRAGPRLQLLS
jgi:hypothetical protein